MHSYLMVTFDDDDNDYHEEEEINGKDMVINFQSIIMKEVLQVSGISFL